MKWDWTISLFIGTGCLFIGFIVSWNDLVYGTIIMVSGLITVIISLEQQYRKLKNTTTINGECE